MEALIIIGIIVVLAVWIGITSLISRLAEGKKAEHDLRKSRSELYDLKKHCDATEQEHKQELHKLRRKIEQQRDVIHNVKIELKNDQERYEATVEQKDLLFKQIKNRHIE